VGRSGRPPRFGTGRATPGSDFIVSPNVGLLEAPGNVLLRADTVGLARDSVVNVTQFVTVDRDYLEKKVGRVAPKTVAKIEAGVRLVLEI
jgi:mRNA interferase MazF